MVDYQALRAHLRYFLRHPYRWLRLWWFVRQGKHRYLPFASARPSPFNSVRWQMYEEMTLAMKEDGRWPTTDA